MIKSKSRAPEEKKEWQDILVKSQSNCENKFKINKDDNIAKLNSSDRDLDEKEKILEVEEEIKTPQNNEQEQNKDNVST